MRWKGDRCGDVKEGRPLEEEEEREAEREKRVLSSLRIPVPSFASLGLVPLCGSLGLFFFGFVPIV